MYTTFGRYLQHTKRSRHGDGKHNENTITKYVGRFRVPTVVPLAKFRGQHVTFLRDWSRYFFYFNVISLPT